MPRQQLSSEAGAKISAKQRSWCPDIKLSFAREAKKCSKVVFPPLPGVPKIDPFGNRTPECRYMRKTYYLHFSHVLDVAKTPKYRYFPTPNPPKTPTSPPSHTQASRYSRHASPVAQPSRQIGKFPSRARPCRLNGSLSLVCPGYPKSTTLVPEYQNTDISQKHTIYYTLAMF